MLRCRVRLGWQLTYDRRASVPEGTKFEATATFIVGEQSVQSRSKASVRFGDRTWDEMMVGFIDIASSPTWISEAD
jgi:hypothetical protein